MDIKAFRLFIALLVVLLLPAPAFPQTKAGGTVTAGGTVKTAVSSGGGGAFVSASFTVGSDTPLASYTGETGATFTLHPSYTGEITVNASLDRIFLTSAASAAYYASGTPPSADYCVSADFNELSNISTNLSVIIGFDTTADTGLLLRLNRDLSRWEVIDRVTGANTTLNTSTSNVPTTGGAAVNAKICRSGTAVTAFFDGVQNTALNSTTTLTAVGTAGIRIAGQTTSTTGIHLDNFVAQ